MFISIISFIVVFTIVALVHEFGHYFAAKKSGIMVQEFGLGFGPKLWSFKKGDTVYAVNLIPILGYVKIAGMEDEDESIQCPEDQKYHNKSNLSKFFLSFLGPLMNIILAFLILTFIFAFAGVPDNLSNVIEKVNPGSPADAAGLKSGDAIISLDGKHIQKMESAIDYIHKNPDKKISFVVSRGNHNLTFIISPKYDPKLKVGLVGFSPKPIYKKVGFISAIFYGAQQTIAMVIVMLVIVFKLFTGGISIGELAGPVGIAQITGTYAQSGVLVFMHFLAFLNVNIGVINLLPLPALDGGRIVFVLIGLIRRKPINMETENKVHQWGLIVLLAFMALITIHDVLRLFRLK